MTFWAHYVSTVVVCLWNLLSMIVEYRLLHGIYTRHPDLAVKSVKSLGKNTQPKRSLLQKIFRPCFSIRDGWRSYMGNKVASAGVCLALMYMTVLNFEGMSNSYARTQGLSESLISIMMASGAAAGVTGTIVFPLMRRRNGLERTGLFAGAAQLFCLAFCVISIWLPGSSFDPNFLLQTHDESWVQRAEENRNITDIDSHKWITRPVEELPSVLVFMVAIALSRFG